MRGIFLSGIIAVYLLGGSGASSLPAEEVIFSGEFQQRIPAVGDGQAWMEPVQLLVDRHLIIKDIDVYFDITHTQVGDLRIFLDGPEGESLMLKELWLPWQEEQSNMYGTVFDDEASLHIYEGSPPYTGRFLPDEGSLAIFDGSDAYGLWTLSIWDGYPDDYGTLDKWELHITTAPEPVSFVYLLIPMCWRIRKGRRACSHLN